MVTPGARRPPARHSSPISRGAVAVAALLVVTACQRESEVAGGTTAPTVPSTSVPTSDGSLPPVSTTSPTSTDVPGSDPPAETAPATAPPTPPTPPAPPPVVTSDVVGVAVAGNSGGIGEGATDSYSEAIRNEDGTCTGWSGRDVPPPWTAGLVSGAPFTILDRDDRSVIGRGNLGTSSFENVGVETDQWNCSFPFAATVAGQHDDFLIQVEGLEPWLVRRDPTDPSRFVASVNTVASIDYFPVCTDGAIDPVQQWQAVGSYWSDGLQALCGAGLEIVDLERPCRRPTEGSDHVALVTSADDPSVVYEDATGLLIDVSTLPPGAPVVVHIATGRPCG